MRTPRSTGNRRGIGTLIGNGWLHESPRNVWPREWDIRGHSTLRKSMFLPVSPVPKDLEDLSSASMPHPPLLKAQPLTVHRHDPRKDAMMVSANTPKALLAKKRAALYADEKGKLLQHQHAPMGGAWFEDPVALGTLLILFPPVGFAALWSSKRYSNDARWALTMMTALTMCLATAIVVAVLALCS